MVGRVRLAQDSRVKGEPVSGTAANREGANEDELGSTVKSVSESSEVVGCLQHLRFFCAEQIERWIDGGVGHGHYVQ